MNLLPEHEINELPSEIDTFVGKFPTRKKTKEYIKSPAYRKEMEELANLGGSIGSPGFNLIGQFGKQISPTLSQYIKSEIPNAKDFLKKSYEYISPSKISEETEKFRSSLGANSESENISNLSKRVKFAEESGKSEALPLKEKLYKQEGKSNLYKIGKEKLPEGNLDKLAHIIEPGSEFSESQSKSLSNALKEFRKGKKDKKGDWKLKPGDIDNFVEKSEDIFGIPDLSKKAASKIEEALLLPISRESKYFSNDKISKYFDRDLKELHNNYKNNPTLSNYDELQSALKTEIRSLKGEGKINRKTRRVMKEYNYALSGLKKDADEFFETLPEEMKNLQSEFSKKWATGPAKYGSEAKITLQRLASGKPGDIGQIKDSDIINLFTKPNKNTLDSIKELGPSVGNNIIYTVLNKVKPGDYNKMAETVLDLSNKRGFEGFVTKDMIEWAKRIKDRSKTSSIVRKGLGTAGGAIAGSMVAGPIGGIAGGMIGAGSPFIKQYLEKIGKIKK